MIFKAQIGNILSQLKNKKPENPKPSKVTQRHSTATATENGHALVRQGVWSRSDLRRYATTALRFTPSRHRQTDSPVFLPHTFLRQPWQEVSVLSICRSSSAARSPGARGLRHTPQTGFFGFRHSCRHAEQKLEQDTQRTRVMHCADRTTTMDTLLKRHQ